MCQLDVFLEENRIDIFCACEHWLLPAELHAYKLLEFETVTSYCRPSKKHGGVAIFIRRGLVAVEIPVGNFCIEIHFEVSALHLVDENIIVIVIYRSPSGDIEIF